MSEDSKALDPALIARIQKMYAMAESAAEVGSLEEADSFMTGVHKTLAANNLDMSVLSLDMKNLTDPMGKQFFYGIGKNGRASVDSRKTLEWITDLGEYIARAHFCACHWHPGSNYLTFYGRETNRKVAMQMFTYLRDMAEKLAWKQLEKEAARRRKLGEREAGLNDYRLNWIEGFVAEVGQRYRDMRDRVETDNSMALVLVGVRKEAQAFADTKLSKLEFESYKLAPGIIINGNPIGGVPLGEIPDDWLEELLKAFREGRLSDLVEYRDATVRKEAVKNIKAQLERNRLTETKESDRYYHSARESGREAARSVNLRPQTLDGGSSSSSKRLGRG